MIYAFSEGRMGHVLSFLGFFDIEVETPLASDRERLEEFAVEIGPVDIRPGEFYKEVLALMAEGVEHPEEFADAALRIVRGAETINSMVVRVDRAAPPNGVRCEPIVPSDRLLSDEIEFRLED
jgi:hypothetical protein